MQMKQPTSAFQLKFFADAQDISHLSGWVKTSGQTTDGHLVQLPIAHGAALATLDERIPGAFVIPWAVAEPARLRIRQHPDLDLAFPIQERH